MKLVLKLFIMKLFIGKLLFRFGIMSIVAVGAVAISVVMMLENNVWANDLSRDLYSDDKNVNDHLYDYRPKNNCVIEADIINIGAGEFTSRMPDGVGGVRIVKIIFTELQLHVKKYTDIVAGGCSLIQQRKSNLYGLCEDIDLYKGDKIKSGIDRWQYSAGCLSNVFVLDKAG